METKERVDYNKLKLFLENLDVKLKGDLKIIAFGGTSLTLLGLKQTSKDIDLIVESGNEKFRQEIAKFLFSQAHCRIDVCPKGYITPFYKLPSDYRDRSIEVEDLNRNLKKIKLFALDPLDVLVSKIGRFDDRDEDDVKDLIRKKGYTFSEIQTRFGLYLRGYQKDKEEFMKKFTLFERFYLGEFGSK